jgi:long-chain fatty acid transport protein
MKANVHYRRLGGALVLGLGLPCSTLAGGIMLSEIATPDLGLASAGYAARAQDASTVFRNPAGMSFLSGSQFQAGAQLIYGRTEFSAGAGTSSFLGDQQGGNSIGWIPSASVFFTQALSEKVVVGMGIFSYFGLAQDYDDDWVGRYYVQEDALLGMSLMPSVSVRVTDWLSVGAGLNAIYGWMDTQVAVRTLGQGDGRMEIEDEVCGFGANAGLLMTPREGTRLGVTYLSPVSLDFADTPSFSNLGGLGTGILGNPPRLDLGVTVPQSVMLSGYHELGPKWALLGNVGWQNWDQFGRVEVGVDSSQPASLTKDLAYEDTWHGAVGAQYRASETWLLSAGCAYDTSAVSDGNRTVGLPMGEGYRFGLGAQWQLKESLILGAAYEFMWGGDLQVVQESNYRGRLSGAYEDTWFSFIDLHLTWKF